MKSQQLTMNPQDIVVLLKIITYGDELWLQKPMAEALHISQSEISKSLMRLKYMALLDYTGKKVFKSALIDFLQYGIRHVFPQQPGPIVRGIATSHSAQPLNQIIQSTENYVWPYAKGTMKGQSIIPLYPSVVEAVQKDDKLYELLALIDALRVGKAREREIALTELKVRILNGK